MCIRDSYDTFAKGPAELAAREYTEKDLNDFIVGTVAKLDTPRKPRAEAVSYTHLDVYKRQPDQLENTPGVGKQTAQTIYDYFHA